MLQAFYEASTTKDRPTALICKTFKGKGFVSEVEDKLNWHGKPLGAKAEQTLQLLEKQMSDQNGDSVPAQNPVVEDVPHINIADVRLNKPPQYTRGE